MLVGALPTLIGIPIDIRNRTIQLEINIYDANRIQIKKYIYTESSKYMRQLYTNNNYRIAGINIIKEIMNKFKYDLETDVNNLNNQLIETGIIN